MLINLIQFMLKKKTKKKNSSIGFYYLVQTKAETAYSAAPFPIRRQTLSESFDKKHSESDLIFFFI